MQYAYSAADCGPLPTAITTRADVELLVERLQAELGPGFHPDTPHRQYVNLDTDAPTYTEAEAELRDRLMAQAFAVVGADLDEIGLDRQYRMLGWEWSEAKQELVRITD
jgi:hypothetical protein